MEPWWRQRQTPGETPTSDDYIFKTNNKKNLKFSEILSLNLLYKKASMNNMQEKSSFEDIIVGS